MKKHIPNSITCCNLVSGSIATFYAFAGNAEMALIIIICPNLYVTMMPKV